MKKFTVTDEKIFCVYKALVVKDTSGTNLRTSNPQLLQKDCQYREQDSENKILS